MGSAFPQKHAATPNHRTTICTRTQKSLGASQMAQNAFRATIGQRVRRARLRARSSAICSMVSLVASVRVLYVASVVKASCRHFGKASSYRRGCMKLLWPVCTQQPTISPTASTNRWTSMEKLGSYLWFSHCATHVSSRKNHGEVVCRIVTLSNPSRRLAKLEALRQFNLAWISWQASLLGGLRGRCHLLHPMHRG